MAKLIRFTNNYRDCSTEKGYQFEFNCDGCGDGLMSPFKPSKLGIAAGILRNAGGLLGALSGGADSMANTADDLMRGKERDTALDEAVVEMKKLFKQCGRCGKWVCPEACWNEKKNLCEACAPDLEEELINIQETTKVEQLKRKAREANLVGDIDVTQPGGKAAAAGGSAAAICEGCGSSITGKFCGTCGMQRVEKAAEAPKAAGGFCSGCGTKFSAGDKFCGGCGGKVG
ncbi:MAG: hypothetical protein K2W85_03020 [Phycisphaerales bacterium]|nr:hypothetical protein [Phycisphaerales bacterium]